MSDERYYKNYPERETEQDEAPKPDAQYYAGKDEEETVIQEMEVDPVPHGPSREYHVMPKKKKMSKIYKKSSHIYVNFPIINSRAVKNRTAAKTYVFIKIQFRIYDSFPEFPTGRRRCWNGI